MDAVSQSLLGCATHSTSPGHRGSSFNAFDRTVIGMADRWRSQCFIFPRLIWYQFLDIGKTEGLTGLGAKKKPSQGPNSRCRPQPAPPPTALRRTFKEEADLRCQSPVSNIVLLFIARMIASIIPSTVVRTAQFCFDDGPAFSLINILRSSASGLRGPRVFF